MEELDSKLREAQAQVGVVTASDVSNAANASDTPADGKPELERVKVSVDASDEQDARSKLEEALRPGQSWASHPPSRAVPSGSRR